MTQVLEQMLSSGITEGQIGTPQTIDIYTSGLSQMYSGLMGPPKPLIPSSMPSFGNYVNDIGLNNIENKYGVSERFDFGGHNNGVSGPHLQYDLITPEDKPIKFPRPLGQSTDRIDLGQQNDFKFSILGNGNQRKLTDF